MKSFEMETNSYVSVSSGKTTDEAQNKLLSAVLFKSNNVDNRIDILKNCSHWRSSLKYTEQAASEAVGWKMSLTFFPFTWDYMDEQNITYL